MPGRVRDADVAAVRERNPIAEVIGATVSLRPAGGGRLKGLCPFHEEKSPSFSVNPSLGVYHCFGCGASGDVITFLRQTEGLSFTEVVEVLARRAGMAVTFEQGSAGSGRDTGSRERLLTAHREAAAFYAEALHSDRDGAALGRRFLLDRGFDEGCWERFGVGYAPRGWDELTRHLRGRGLRTEELVTGGLAREGQRGPGDRFRGRLVWPIRDRTGDVIGFGARRLDDPGETGGATAAGSRGDGGPKYLNTPETPLYRKSAVLYGLDLARRAIATGRQAVVVEGYTDVMACHLAGVPTAVATCGTAFGVEHVQVLRLLLTDEDAFRGEVIFTFDGDSAGQRAALRSFTSDQRFVGQTFVAVTPGGMDPCDLRLTRGDAAVRELISTRQPLFAFVLRSTLTGYNLDTAEGRVGALRACAPIVANIRDRALRPEYARELAGWLGMETETVRRAVFEAGRSQPRGSATGGEPGRGRGAGAPAGSDAGRAGPSAGSAPPTAESVTPAGSAPPGAPGTRATGLVATLEREALKVAVQYPALAAPLLAGLPDDAVSDPGYREVIAAIRALPCPAEASAAAAAAWLGRLRGGEVTAGTAALLTELAVEPLPLGGEAPARYAGAVFARLEELAVGRKLITVKSRLERADADSAAEQVTALLTEMDRLERYRQALRLRALGGG